MSLCGRRVVDDDARRRFASAMQSALQRKMVLDTATQASRRRKSQKQWEREQLPPFIVSFTLLLHSMVKEQKVVLISAGTTGPGGAANAMT